MKNLAPQHYKRYVSLKSLIKKDEKTEYFSESENEEDSLDHDSFSFNSVNSQEMDEYLGGDPELTAAD